eukprot:TRINITY_DN3191_c0_g1_i1.p1 TRINITY_DN3191_c0_g1~~TRINITY_DN3191_c0_g1_i1.p1  ORF type:complete len:601 (-),score=127.48 TRINITY_DN3191_c0_g1_i1:55-1857(-)
MAKFFALKDYAPVGVAQVESANRRKRLVVAGATIGMLIICMSVLVAVSYKNQFTFDTYQIRSLKATHGAVAADNPTCSEIGVQVLKKGGNAMDAAVSVAICQGVLYPFASGIGGGAGLIIRLANGTTEFIDFREKAPAAADQNMYVSNPTSAIWGSKAIAVPGELKGLEVAWNGYKSGNLTWKELFDPMISWCKDGYKVSSFLASRLQVIPLDKWNSAMKKIWAPKGTPLKEGETVTLTELGNTLQRVANEGTDVIYNGEIGQKLVQDIQSEGGILTMDDLRNYDVKIRPTLRTFYNGYEVIGAYAPLSGGPCIALALNILEFYKLDNLYENRQLSQVLHWVIEALNFAYADRMALGDPDFVNVTEIIELMASKHHASILRRDLSANQTFPPIHYQDLTEEISNLENHGTSHFSIVDEERNAVAMTTTVNLPFGAAFVSESTGILLNDEMDDFSTPNQSNAYGYPPSKANFIAPGKRPLSSMSPTIVLKNEQLHLVVGGSGGSRIISEVLQAILGVIAFDRDIYDVINDPRFHSQLIPPGVSFENTWTDLTVLERLAVFGHLIIKANTTDTTAMQGIVIDDENQLFAASDHRKDGKPAGY